MEIASVRALKEELFAEVVAPVVAAASAGFGIASSAIETQTGVLRSVALGIGNGNGATGFRLAIRIQRRALEIVPAFVQTLIDRAGGEADVRYIGAVAKRATPWHQQRQRPLKIGSTIGHYRISAGTLGMFARDRTTNQLLILSNNHVLADEGRGLPGDPIWQPGSYDHGGAADAVGTLLRAVPLTTAGANFADVAVATIAAGIAVDANNIEGLGTLAGLRQAPLTTGTEVAKLGRTTGLRRGRVTATEIDNLVVGFKVGDIRFDNQIEIESVYAGPFSSEGDSGSLIVDSQNRACGLLFAGSDHGGSNNSGVTYANPIAVALDAIGATMA